MKIKELLALVGVGLALSFTTGRVDAQGGGGGGGFGPGGGGGGGGGGFGGGRGFAIDPVQIRQMMLDNARDQLEVKDDGEWKVIGDQVGKVFDAQQAAIGGSVNMLRLMRRNNNTQGAGANGQQGTRRAGGIAGMFGGTPTPEDEALQSAIDRNAPSAELKAAITKVQAVRKQRQDALDKAHTDLRQLLTPRQEAIAITLGLL